MRILVNLISLFQGGPKTVGMGILEGIESLMETDDTISFYFISPTTQELIDKIHKLQLKFGKRITIKKVRYPHRPLNFLYKLYFDHVYTAIVAFKNDITFIFMTANFPSLMSRKSQIVLMHNLHYLISGNPFTKNSLKLRFILEKQLFKFTIRKQPLYLVQTNYIKQKMNQVYNISNDSIIVKYMIPPESFTSFKPMKTPHILSKHKDSAKLFLPAKYHPNKNFALLKNVASIISERRSNIKFFVTLKDNEYKAWLGSEYNKLKEYIINIGEIKYQEIRNYYENIDLVLFPTSAESYGFPFIEAMICNKAIATTSTEFSRELLDNEGYYFELNAESMIKAIEIFIEHPKVINYQVTLSKIPSWLEYMENVLSKYSNHR